MKRMLVSAVVAIALVSCKETVTTEVRYAENGKVMETGGISLDELGDPVADSYMEYYGIWDGEIANDEDAAVTKAFVKIVSIEEDNVHAYIAFGEDKLFIGGKQETKDGKFYLKLKQGSGNRERNIIELFKEGDNLAGTYTKKTGEPAKKVVLTHRPFTYDANAMLESSSAVDWEKSKTIKKTYTDEDGKKFSYNREGHRATSDSIPALNASVQKLTEDQLKNLRKIDLEVLRNTIYARHGYTFEKSYLRNLFNRTEWYVPVSDNVENELTELEKKNIKLIKRVEKYAKDHYEYFGR